MRIHWPELPVEMFEISGFGLGSSQLALADGTNKMCDSGQKPETNGNRNVGTRRSEFLPDIFAIRLNSI
jgi:hypothetical protein